MDIKVSRKERRLQPKGPVMELVDDIFDLYPVYGNEFDVTIITDVEVITDAQEEQLDRAMFAIVKQRGADPIHPDDGIQWAEYILGETHAAAILVQIQAAVYEEGSGIRLEPSITTDGVEFKVELTNPRPRRARV